MQSELISTGSELLSGRTVNRHAQALAQALAPMGIELVRDTTLPDDRESITETIREAAARVSLVFVSGGLGPTVDDISRDAVAALLDRELETDDEALEAIRKKCEERGLVFSEARQRQALVVAGAEVLANSVGAAPGERLEVGDSILFMLPGPPDEFHAVLHEQVIPRLKKQEDVRAGHIFMVCGLAEADMIERFEKEDFPPPGVDVAFCAAPGRIEVRLSAASDAAIQPAINAARELLGTTVFAEARRAMEEVVGELLADRGETLAVAESCTGGLLGHRLTNVSGSSNYFKGGVLAYSNESKCRDLGVEEAKLQEVGAVSAEAAQQMADGVRGRFGSTYGIGITGIAGPTGGTEEKPVGLVFISLSGPDGTAVRRYTFGGGRARVKQWSSQMALNMLRLQMVGALDEDG